MKKSLFRLILALALALVSITPAFAAGERSLTLVSIYYIQGKGVVFTFSPQGKFKASELSGTVTVNGLKYTLSCQFADNGDVKCMADKGMSRYVNQYASGQVAGYPFGGLIRNTRFPYCYGVWNQNQLVNSICGSNAAANGDWILLNNNTFANFDENGPNGPGFYVYDTIGL